MGGVLTHVSAGLLSAIIIYFIHFRLEFSLAIFLGNLLPDALKFGISAIAQGTIKIFYVEKDALFWKLANITNNPTNYLAFGFFVFGTTLLLYYWHKIKKKKMFEYDELYIFLLIGIITHLIIDELYSETSPWI